MPRKSKTKPIRPIMTLCETETSYCATVNGESVTVQKDAIEINNGIRNHPRLMAIEAAAKQAQIADWYECSNTGESERNYSKNSKS